MPDEYGIFTLDGEHITLECFDTRQQQVVHANRFVSMSVAYEALDQFPKELHEKHGSFVVRKIIES